MNKFKSSVAVGLIALMFTASAHASNIVTFNLDTLGAGLLQGTTQGTSLGTVTLTQTGNTVAVNVALATGAYFVNTGGPHTPFVFNLGTTPTSVSAITATQTDLTTTSTSVFTYSVGPLGATPFGYFDNGVVCSSCSNGGSPPHYSMMDFTITGVSNSDFIGNNDSSGNWYVGADVFYNQYTGTVASGTPMSPVPEPHTYAMLLAGLGLMGFIALRKNRGGMMNYA